MPKRLGFITGQARMRQRSGVRQVIDSHGDGVAVSFVALGMLVSSIDGGPLRASNRSQAHCSPAEQSS
jgi:hypothetical protein